MGLLGIASISRADSLSPQLHDVASYLAANSIVPSRNRQTCFPGRRLLCSYYCRIPWSMNSTISSAEASLVAGWSNVSWNSDRVAADVLVQPSQLRLSGSVPGATSRRWL